MAYNADYRELMDNAEEAIRALLGESTEESWIDLRAGLREIGQAIRDDERRDRLAELREDFQEQADEARRNLEEFRSRREAIKGRDPAYEHNRHIVDEYRERKQEWRRMPMARKEALIIEALGEDRRTVREVTERLNESLGWQANSCLYREAVEGVVRRLLASGQLDRVRLQIGAREVWHYFMRRGLEGPIADLERVWREAA